MTWQFDRCGDHLALDFANTVSEGETDRPIERLVDYADLVDFARQCGIVDDGRAGELLAQAAQRPAQAEAAHQVAVALRDALYALFRNVARQRPVRAQDLAVLNGELGRLRVGPTLALTWHDQAGALDGWLGAVVHAAVRLATTPSERARVRVCEAPDCEWLFYDGSRNQSRRWCDMRQCGNRMKARRHYARGRGGDAAPQKR